MKNTFDKDLNSARYIEVNTLSDRQFCCDLTHSF